MTSPFLIRGAHSNEPTRALTDDNPTQDLLDLERDIKDGLDAIAYKLQPQIDALGRQGIDVDINGLIQRAKEDVDDEIGADLNRLYDER